MKIFPFTRNEISCKHLLKAISSLAGCLFEHKTGLWKVEAKDNINTIRLSEHSFTVLATTIQYKFTKTTRFSDM